MNSALSEYLRGIEQEFTEIPDSRIECLHIIIDYIKASLEQSNTASLVFICTHNSRRSQLGQAWASAAARYCGIENIRAYSGGTEATAFNPRAVEALKRAGFTIVLSEADGINPICTLSSGPGQAGDRMFSKKYDDPSNPDRNFCAIMVCSDADEACPFVPGASERVTLPYDDPKAFDGTVLETVKYDERCREIARDLLYVFSKIR